MTSKLILAAAFSLLFLSSCAGPRTSNNTSNSKIPGEKTAQKPPKTTNIFTCPSCGKQYTVNFPVKAHKKYTSFQ